MFSIYVFCSLKDAVNVVQLNTNSTTSRTARKLHVRPSPLMIVLPNHSVSSPKLPNQIACRPAELDPPSSPTAQLMAAKATKLSFIIQVLHFLHVSVLTIRAVSLTFT